MDIIIAPDTAGDRDDIGNGLVLIRSRTSLVRGGCLDWGLDAWAPDGTFLGRSDDRR